MTLPDGELRAARLANGLGHERYCAEVVEQTRLLREALTGGTDLAAPVPTCPGWTLDDLVRHVGGALRWVELMVRTQAPEDVPDGSVPGAGGPDEEGPEALDDWLAETAEMAAETLRAAGAEADVWSWSPDRTAGFWARRMTHELVIHRADASLAAGLPYAVAPEVAADALDEWLDVVRFKQSTVAPGSGAGVVPEDGAGRSLLLDATDAPPGLDAEWVIRLDKDDFTWSRGRGGAHGASDATAAPAADVALRGPLTEVLLAFYRRRSLDDGRLSVAGERGLLDFWLERASFG
ncbi:maleylpyruvate isomerase family mycothiol-dependent enzyme [Streptomyces sp. TS71-3]|uniref:maleylpyruvate isomerase family mycothiol-dependent enzyme n=1 Tax=Streptomyces sp. TS71-3 TaxID=2733862 RepID=UPI001B2E89DF|nr:maleylpyruvate isomerase family mycothiol-dependent enzyme [Streptomyces sp. TS71-3]GHJ36328.1 hypothetical protein Sm713_19370 [Streptomyces sp. TS71-3]